MEKDKETIYIESCDMLSYGYDGDHLTVMLCFNGFRAGADSIEEVFIDFPMHEDNYDAMKYYCSKYEEYMIKKFAEK
jgi:hypothetical protein